MMATIKRSDLNQFYYNEGIEWRKVSDNPKEMMDILNQLTVSEDEKARDSFHMGVLDESLRIAMLKFAEAYIQAGLDSTEVAMVILAHTTAGLKEVEAIARRRLLGL